MQPYLSVSLIGRPDLVLASDFDEGTVAEDLEVEPRPERVVFLGAGIKDNIVISGTSARSFIQFHDDNASAKSHERINSSQCKRTGTTIRLK